MRIKVKFEDGEVKKYPVNKFYRTVVTEFGEFPVVEVKRWMEMVVGKRVVEVEEVRDV